MFACTGRGQYVSKVMNPDKTLSYFAEGASEYRELVEAQAQYQEDEEAIQTEMKEDEMWLPV